MLFFFSPSSSSSSSSFSSEWIMGLVVALSEGKESLHWRQCLEERRFYSALETAQAAPRWVCMRQIEVLAKRVAKGFLALFGSTSLLVGLTATFPAPSVE